MTVDTSTAQPQTDVADTPDDAAVSSSTSEPVADESTETTPAVAEPVEDEKPKRGRPKAAAVKKPRTLELTLTVTGTADGEWHAELKQGSTWIARGVPVAAAAVSRAAKELHEELSAPIDEVIDAAREQQAAKVAALEAELEAARKALAELAD
jgi:Family of unknown function (DUF6319)